MLRQFEKKLNLKTDEELRSIVLFKDVTQF